MSLKFDKEEEEIRKISKTRGEQRKKDMKIIRREILKFVEDDGKKMNVTNSDGSG